MVLVMSAEIKSLVLDTWAGRRYYAVELVGQTPKKARGGAGRNGIWTAGRCHRLRVAGDGESALDASARSLRPTQARETGEELRGGHFNTHPHDRGGGALTPAPTRFYEYPLSFSPPIQRAFL